MRFRHPRGDRADAHLAHQLDADPRRGVAVLEVVDQLRKVLDRVNVVVRRRADQADTRSRMTHRGDLLVDLPARKLAALTGLGALRHLDLDLIGVGEVVDGHPETPRSDLLDRRAHRVHRAIRKGQVPLRVLTTLTGVGFAAELVHGDRQSRMRLHGDRTEAHRACRKPLHDLARWLDFAHRNALALLESHQAA